MITEPLSAGPRGCFLALSASVKQTKKRKGKLASHADTPVLGDNSTSVSYT